MLAALQRPLGWVAARRGTAGLPRAWRDQCDFVTGKTLEFGLEKTSGSLPGWPGAGRILQAKGLGRGHDVLTHRDGQQC